MIFRVRCHHFSSLACALGVAFGTTGRGDDEPFPGKPAGLVADQAGVLLPERAGVLNQYLMAGAREHGVSVYLLTVNSPGVRAAAKTPRLSALGHRYADRWLPDAVGMIILFDDDARAAVVVASRETDRRFPPLQRNMVLDEPLRQLQRGEGLSRDKLEVTATTLFTALSQLQDQANADARRHRMINLAMAAIALVGVALLLRGSLKKVPGVQTPKAAD